MKGKAPRLYHVAAAVYLLWLDRHLVALVLDILTTRQDIVKAHWVGLGLQFFTVWSQIAQQIFSFSILAEDVIVVGGIAVKKRTKNKLHNFNSWLHTCVVFPAAIVVAVNFWTMYSFLEDNLIEDMAVMKHVPLWMNHSLHTVILVLPLFEMSLSYRPYPDRMRGLLAVLGVILCYCSWVVFARVVGGRWPYPFMSILPARHIFCYWVGNFLLAAVSYLLGDFVNYLIWGNQTRGSGKQKFR
ncbi:androgen-induced gene 1 protein-like [Periplaneta americana]|uniref:androgen-induced gene 1 protein-like n=1 Tax=Periplaneta americana TaxID=6978 RepID=UPI0037E9851D